MTRALVTAACVIAACTLVYFVPLARVVPIEKATHDEAFDAEEFAKTFWEDSLRASFDQAHDAAAVAAALADDPAAARDAFGRTSGISRGFLLYVRGEGVVAAVEKKGVTVDVDEDDRPDLRLHTGLVFGPTVRDAPGLLPPDALANSQQLNDVATALNRMVEEDVIPLLVEAAKPGARVKFIGCGAVDDPARFDAPLEVVPVSVTFE